MHVQPHPLTLGRTPASKGCYTQSGLGSTHCSPQESQKDHTVDRFIGVTETIDDRLKKSTIGLVTLDDFKKTKDDLEEEQRQVAAKTIAST